VYGELFADEAELKDKARLLVGEAVAGGVRGAAAPGLAVC